MKLNDNQKRFVRSLITRAMKTRREALDMPPNHLPTYAGFLRGAWKTEVRCAKDFAMRVMWGII